MIHPPQKNTSTPYLIALAVAWFPLALAAGDHGDKASTEAIDVPAIWSAQCASCHGNDGRGQTRIGRRSGVEDLTVVAYQESFTDEEAFIAIKEGLTRNGREAMKPFGEGLADENGLADAEIHALVAYVRAYVSGG